MPCLSPGDGDVRFYETEIVACDPQQRQAETGARWKRTSTALWTPTAT